MATDKGRSASVYRLMLILLLTGVESQREGPPSMGLYFTLSGTVYLPNDTILITNIGSENTDDRSDPGSSLVCVTTNVNTHCCRSDDNPNGESRGEWYLPNGTKILSTHDTNFYSTLYAQQVRLNRRNNAMSPTGVFTCVVPNDTDSTKNHTATIRIKGDMVIALMVVISMALVVVLVLILIIILLVLFILNKRQTKKDELEDDYDDIIGIRDGAFCEIPSITNMTNSQSKVTGYALNQCPAYEQTPSHQ